MSPIPDIFDRFNHSPRYQNISGFFDNDQVVVDVIIANPSCFSFLPSASFQSPTEYANAMKNEQDYLPLLPLKRRTYINLHEIAERQKKKKKKTTLETLSENMNAKL